MAGSLNKVMIIGNLTRDPELKYLPSGVAVCSLSVATNRYSRDAQSGERREFTEFHNVEVFDQGQRKLAELCGQYLQKGRKVYVEGELRTRSWDDATSGQKRYRTEIRANDVQFLDSRNDAAGAPPADYGNAPASARGAAPASGGGGDIDPDDIPF